MSFFASLFGFKKAPPAPAPKPVHRVLLGEQVDVMLRAALNGRAGPQYRHLGQKRRMRVLTREMMREASDRSFRPWVEDRHECEDIARDMQSELQHMAAETGCTGACGVLRAVDDTLEALEAVRHVWVWGVVESSPNPRLALFDPTARKWADFENLTDADYTLT